MTEVQTCQSIVADNWSTRTCGKPVKGTLANGQPACGRHLSVERMRNERNERDRAERQAEVERYTQMQRLCSELKERGIEARPDHQSRYRRITVEPDSLMRVLSAVSQGAGQS